ncbi:MAG: murein biosynthesis integral membrane protein MurJ [Chloroflexi bacterium]|nr:murein biosynthesis integral membrane protein MurJ [Chloroflexota bacterium]
MNRIARNASLVMAGFVAANLLGLLRQVFINHTFGTSAALDAYFAAFRAPDLLFTVIAGGALGSAFIPMFGGMLAEGEGGPARAWRLASAVLNNLLLALCLIAALAAVAAPVLVRTLLAPGFSPAQQALTAALMRVMLLSTIIFGVSGLLMGVHNAHHHFLSPAIAPILYNLGIIGGALMAQREQARGLPLQGVYWLAWGVVAGAAMHLLVQLPALVRHRPRYSLALDWADSAVRQVGKLMLPRMFGLAVWQINFWVNVAIASTLPSGSLSALTIAFQVFTFPQAAIAQAIATAVFPTFSAQAARGEREALGQTLTTALRLTLFLALPATAGMLLLGKPIIALVFEGGQFTAQSTALVAWALAWYGVGLVGHSVVEVVTRAFYALKDTRTPVLVGAGAMALNVIFSLTFTRAFTVWGWPPLGGLALANSLATAIEMLGLVILLVGSRGEAGARGIPLNGPSLRASVSRAAAASAVMALAVWAWARWLPSPTWLTGLGGAAVGAAVYFALAWALRSEEMGTLLRGRG